MLSDLPHRPSDSNDDDELSGPDITDKTFEVSMINPFTCTGKYHTCSLNTIRYLTNSIKGTCSYITIFFKYFNF